MSRNAKPSPWLRASAVAGGDPATISPSAARDDAVALLRLAGLDHAELANALKRDEAEVLAMSCERRRKTARLAEKRDAALARVSPSLRARYEAAIQDGLRPALAAVHDGRCPGCGETLPDATRRFVQESLRVVPCSGCLRLLYDRGWIERDLMPSTLRPVTRAKP